MHKNNLCAHRAIGISLWSAPVLLSRIYFLMLLILLRLKVHLLLRQSQRLKGALYGIETSTRNNKIWPTRERQHRQYLKITC